jgi:hypothetical protein
MPWCVNTGSNYSSLFPGIDCTDSMIAYPRYCSLVAQLLLVSPFRNPEQFAVACWRGLHTFVQGICATGWLVGYRS